VNNSWIADRMRHIEASGIRRAFDLARQMTDPINLSIGLPDFDVPEPIQDAACAAIRSGFNAYSLTLGLPELREHVESFVRAQYPTHTDRRVIITSGTAGGLVLTLCASVNPGDEVILFDPYFVMYNNLIALAGGTSVLIDAYPDFRLNADAVAAAITPRTKCVIANSPNNPTGVVSDPADLQALATLCRDRNVLLLSDEVYRSFCHDAPFVSPASWNENTVVVDGFSKSFGMTGWRLGFAHGPSALIQEMAKLQQFSFICPPTPLQKAVVGALDRDLSAQAATYRARRDRVVSALSGLYEMAAPAGAFYAFPKVPEGYASASSFVAEAVKHNLLIIPGNTFSRRDTHFRLSYAVDDLTLDRGLEVLTHLARTAPK
jgi:aspartate aminotransferase/aminotransferase